MTSFDFITHYSRGEPFLSITSFPSERWAEVIAGLDETNAWGISRFRDPEYLVRRLAVEKRMRREFIENGGRPVLETPIYFFLGRHQNFEEVRVNKGYRINLADLRSEWVSLTYGDSLLAFDEIYRSQAGADYRHSCCGRVYRLEDLEEVLSGVGGAEQASLKIEVQLWMTPPPGIVREL